MALPHRVVLLSFEGPDHYSSVGALSTRVSQLAHAFDIRGCAVDVIFVGDPAAAAIETRSPNVTLRRWSQRVSSSYPRNAYDGQEQKVLDWESSIPTFVVDSIVTPAAATGERTLIIAEEWQTAKVAIAIDRLARQRGVRNTFTLMWNANSINGWGTIDWSALRVAATITSVSKYLKVELARIGVLSLVIPNGIDARLHERAEPGLLAEVAGALADRPTLVKVGRFEAEKNWMQAVDAVVELHSAEINARLILRGRHNEYADQVLARAYERGLTVERLDYQGSDAHRLVGAIARSDAAIVYLSAFLDESMLSALYAAATAVLVNSGREPFGTVGLEVMAAGGIVVCDAASEEYTEPFVNAIVCDTRDGRELATYLRALIATPSLVDRMRREGAATAERFSWTRALDTLELKVAYADTVMS